MQGSAGEGVSEAVNHSSSCSSVGFNFPGF